jgi:hypothetical protein
MSHINDDIAPVTRSVEPYDPPAVVAREPIAGLLFQTGKSDIPH